MNALSRQVKVLLATVAILVGIITGMVAGILAVLAGATLAAAVGVGGGAVLTTIPVVLGIQKAVAS